MSATRYNQFCALARAAEIVGERWTLLIVRELLLGPKRFGDISDRLDGVSPTVLTARLNNLIEHGIVRKAMVPSPANVQVYELTPLGHNLNGAVLELIRWGSEFLFPRRDNDSFEPDWALLALNAIAPSSPTPRRTVIIKLVQENKQASFVVRGGPAGTSIEMGEGPGNATLETNFETLIRIISGRLSLEACLANGLARLDGSLIAAQSLPRLFQLTARRPAGLPNS